MVSTTGTRWVWAKLASSAVGERIVHAAARDDQRLLGLAQQPAAAATSCSTSGRGRGTRQTVGSKNASG